jgi:hypothetical protein
MQYGFRNDAELMRLQTFYLVNLQLDRNSALKDVKDLMRFAWEDDPIKEVQEPNWEELERDLYKGV